VKIALIGFPQAGKRTLFSLLTGREVAENRRPEEAVEGTGSIGDERVTILSGICRPRRTTLAENRFVLCPDVANGAGSRAWREAAARCDLLCLVVRAFPDGNVYHPAGAVDAERDRKELLTELRLADMERIEKRLQRIEKEKRSGASPAQHLEEAALRTCLEHLEKERDIRDLDLGPQGSAAIERLELLTRLPILEVDNVGENDLSAPADPPGRLRVSARVEQEIAGIRDPEERKAFLDLVGLPAAGLDRMNGAAYDALGLMSFYTVGKDEVRAWTILRGSPAPVAGGKIHSDIERGFIRVEVIKYTELIAAGSEKAAKDQGKVQVRGKEYVMEDGDICHFLFNV
jgi:GTP-binding protein YchF